MGLTDEANGLGGRGLRRAIGEILLSPLRIEGEGEYREGEDLGVESAGVGGVLVIRVKSTGEPGKPTPAGVDERAGTPVGVRGGRGDGLRQTNESKSTPLISAAAAIKSNSALFIPEKSGGS